MRHLLTAGLLLSTALHAEPPGGAALAALISGEFDTNSDDVIDSGEWHAGIQASFTKLDVNQDGSIALDEVDALKTDVSAQAGELGATLVLTLIRGVLASLDTDQNRLVSRQEYEKLTQDIFTRLDADKSLSLNHAELAALPLKIAER